MRAGKILIALSFSALTSMRPLALPMITTVAMASTNTQAQQIPGPGGDAQMRHERIRIADAKKPVKVQVTLTTTGDGCNQLFLKGSFLPIVPTPGVTAPQVFLADFGLETTLIYCRPPRQQHPVVTLKSPVFELQPMGGQIDVTIFLPGGLNLSLLDEER